MSSYIQNNRLKDLVKKNLKSTPPKKNDRLPPRVHIQESNTGDGLKVSVSYYFKLTKSEISSLKSSEHPEQVTKKILEKNLIMISNESSEVIVLISVGDGTTVEVLLDRKDFKKVNFDPSTNTLQCTSEVKSLNFTSSSSETLEKLPSAPQVPRLDTSYGTIRERSRGSVTYDTELRTAPMKNSTNKLYRLEAKASTPITPPLFDLTPAPLVPRGEISNVSISYPAVSELYIETIREKTTGYFSANKKYLFPNLTNTTGYELKIRRRNLSSPTQSPEEEIIPQEMLVQGNNSSLTFYTFEHDYVPGDFEYQLIIKTTDENTQAVKDLLQDSERLLDTKTSQPYEESDIEEMGGIYNRMKAAHGAPPKANFKKDYTSAADPLTLTSEIFKYIDDSRQALEKIHSFTRKPDGSLVSTSKSVLEKEIIFRYHDQGNIIENNLFEKTHTLEQVSKRLSFASQKLEEIPFVIKYENVSSNYDWSEDEGYFLDKAMELTRAANMIKKYEIKIYTLKGYETSYRDNTPLLNHPLWERLSIKEYSGEPTFARADILCSDGTQHREYFIIGN